MDNIQLYMVLGIVIPACSAVVIAVIKRKTITITKQSNSPVDELVSEVKELRDEIEKQHIRIDDISERLAWLEGRNNKK